jgi:hypothetical protein
MESKGVLWANQLNKNNEVISVRICVPQPLLDLLESVKVANDLPDAILIIDGSYNPGNRKKY